MDWIDQVVQDVAELDYNSPEGQTDVMLVKASELRAILESRAPSATLWAVHVQGPDDLHACPDRAVADALALVLNRQFERHGHPDGPPMSAAVVEWPYSREAWQQGADQLRFQAVGA